MERIAEPAMFQRACAAARAAGQRVGLVPTMGALHKGHVSLIERAVAETDFVVVTIFVNPLQFSPSEDLARYPRTLADDLAACAATGANLVFTPERDAMYPSDFQTQVHVKALTQPLEGQHRPGHFDGVTTVVAKLFALTGACRAYFGRKDHQQLQIISRMRRDLMLPIDIVPCPIVRDPDGLALSSRNAYLSPEQRARALSLVAGLRQAHDAWQSGQRSAEIVETLAREAIESHVDKIDYIAAVDPDTLLAPDANATQMLLAIAAHVGGTRLIDNLILGLDPRP